MRNNISSNMQNELKRNRKIYTNNILFTFGFILKIIKEI